MCVACDGCDVQVFVNYCIFLTAIHFLQPDGIIHTNNVYKKKKKSYTHTHNHRHLTKSTDLPVLDARSLVEHTHVDDDDDGYRASKPILYEE